jgi:hypothetical protein
LLLAVVGVDITKMLVGEEVQVDCFKARLVLRPDLHIL